MGAGCVYVQDMSEPQSRASLVFHLPPKQFGADIGNALPFYKRLERQFRVRGGQVRLFAQDASDPLISAQAIESDADFHLVDFGELQHQRVLNVAASYMHPYWNCDPKGVRSLSSIGKMSFSPSEVDGREARRFGRKLRAKLVAERKTHYKQQDEPDEDLADDCIAIFLQREAFRGVQETKYMDHGVMINAVCHFEKRRQVVVKQHPLDTSPETDEMLAEACAKYPNLHVSTANIHDILAKASACVTINSAVGIEGYLHNVPLILCGDADFRHRADVVKAPEKMGVALANTLGKRVPFDKYLYWYFGLNCVDARDDNLLDQVLVRVAQSGFPIARFGLD